MPDVKNCAICDTPGEGTVLVLAEHDNKPAKFCMRCFHGLMHGLSVDDMKQRWEEYQASCKHSGGS